MDTPSPRLSPAPSPDQLIRWVPHSLLVHIGHFEFGRVDFYKRRIKWDRVRDFALVFMGAEAEYFAANLGTKKSKDVKEMYSEADARVTELLRRTHQNRNGVFVRLSAEDRDILTELRKYGQLRIQTVRLYRDAVAQLHDAPRDYECFSRRDGGSLNNTRLELVQVRKDVLGKRKKTSDGAPGDTKEANYKTCAVSREPLRPPVVACKLGYLFNKEALIRFLLERKTKTKQEDFSVGVDAFQHIKSLKDVVDCSRSLQGDEIKGFRVVCPITLQEASSKRRFYVLWKCGCIVSESALRETGFMKATDNGSRSCPVCFTSGQTESDLVLLNPTPEEREKRRKKILSKLATKTQSKPSSSENLISSHSSNQRPLEKSPKNLLDSIFVNNKTRKPEELFTGAVR